MYEINSQNMMVQAQKLSIAADKFARDAQNLSWTAKLKPSETLMLNDVEHEFKLNELDGDENLLKKITKLFFGYSQINDFYKREAAIVKARQNAGLYDKNLGYDPDLTIEDACRKYLGCTKREAEESSHLYQRIDDKYQDYLMMIRNCYTDSLGSLVGKSDEEYEKKFYISLKSFEEASKQYVAELQKTFNPEVIEQLKKVFENVENHIHSK